MKPIQVHQLANRSRRIPRRIKELSTEIRATQTRIDQIENDEDLKPDMRTHLIRRLREQVGPAHAQIRALQDRGAAIGLSPSLLN